MRLTVLGCNGPFPEAGGALSGYLLKAGNTRILLECGSGVISFLTALTEPEKIDGIILSHLHFDHMSDILPLQYRFAMTGKRVKVYAPSAPENVRALLDCPAFEWCDIAAGGKIGEIAFTTLPVRHPVPSYAVRFEHDGKVFCYTGDTNTCESLAGFAAKSDLMLADACFTDEMWHEGLPHLSARKAAEIALRADVKRLILTHFRPDISREKLLEQAQSVFENTCLAQVGLKAEV
ncbi:MAG: MBL fold metallo-hydrolase [Clostridia bacterium]|nr:MBL fold metallo-hydrolase [Clostridia bacterium]